MSKPREEVRGPLFPRQPPVPEVWPLGHPRKRKDQFCTLGPNDIQINGQGLFAPPL